MSVARDCCAASEGRAFTGAWVETGGVAFGLRFGKCRAFTGAWVETLTQQMKAGGGDGRAFTGAWVETSWDG